MASHNNGGNGSNNEPSNAPMAGRWYNLTLGSTFNDNPSSKYCTLRYEFKPASIDKSQAGSLHKNKENRVNVEFQNNQPGKPKVTFEGSSEDYKENDGVLFFDGETFRLERLHRAVKRLRHNRMAGESGVSAPVAPAASAGIGCDSRSPPLLKTTKSQALAKPIAHSVPVEVERIDIGEPESPARSTKFSSRVPEYHSVPPNTTILSPDRKSNELDEHLHLIFGDDEGTPDRTNAKVESSALGFDMNASNENDTDNEIADVDASDDEGTKGPNVAETLRAQVNTEQQQPQTSSSSGSSGSGSRSSGSSSASSSSSSESEASDDDSGSSGGDVDI